MDRWGPLVDQPLAYGWLDATVGIWGKHRKPVKLPWGTYQVRYKVAEYSVQLGCAFVKNTMSAL